MAVVEYSVLRAYWVWPTSHLGYKLNSYELQVGFVPRAGTPCCMWACRCWQAGFLWFRCPYRWPWCGAMLMLWVARERSMLVFVNCRSLAVWNLVRSGLLLFVSTHHGWEGEEMEATLNVIFQPTCGGPLLSLRRHSPSSRFQVVSSPTPTRMAMAWARSIPRTWSLFTEFV